MKIRLNYWQLILLFLPFIVGFQLFHVPYTSATVYIITKSTLNLLLYISPCFIIGYQAYLVINFNKVIKGSKWMTANIIISLVFTLLNFTYLMITTLLRLPYLNSRLGPIEQADFGFISNLSIIFFLYSIITFFIVNNIYVTRQIKKIPDDSLRNQLNLDFRLPMKKLRNMAYIVVASMLLLSMVIDIFVYGVIPNQD